MRHGARMIVTAALLAVVAGCKRNTEARMETGPTAPVPQPPEGAGLDGINMPLSQLLGTERQSRPSDTPRTEQVFAALEGAGLTLADKTQVLGRMIGASFCQNAHSPSGVVFSVCEFKDAAAATKGREYSLRAFGKALPHRDLLINRSTLLTITRSQENAAAQAETQKATKVFQGLAS